MAAAIYQTIRPHEEIMFDLDKKDFAIALPFILLIIFFNPIMTALGLMDPSKEPIAGSASDSTIAQPYVAEESNRPAAESVPSFTEQKATSDGEVTEQQQIIESDTVAADTTLVVTEKYEILLSSHGGGPVSILLKEFGYKNGERIELLSNATEATPDLRLASGSYSTAFLDYTSDKMPGRYDVTSEPFEISFRSNNEVIGGIVKTYRFYPDSYHYDLAITIENPEKLGVQRTYQLEWNTPLGVTEPNPNTDFEAMQAVAMMAGQRESLDDFDNSRLKQELSGNTSWAGVRAKYFAGVIIPTSRQATAAFAEGVKRDITIGDERFEEKKITGGIKMDFPGSVAFTDSFTVFAGPLDYTLMSDYEVGLEDILDIGTMPVVGWLIKPFALGIIWILPVMYNVIPNYGIVIILFALLVKIITMPLSMKSFRSMNAMKELQPKIEKLKAQHKKNPQALNTEMMKLYKANGVNPISGCLPMLPQMPLFFALFRVFQSTILLRQAPFFWFFDDLSVGAASFTDPYILLVILMVGAQFLSQSLTMASTQQNKALMYMMPVFMGWIFHSFPAGLVLYWTCFSLFSLIDYMTFKRNKKNSQVSTT